MNPGHLQNLAALKNAILTYTDFSDEELMALARHIKPATLKKNETLIHEGEVENHIYFIVEGVTRSYFFSHEKEVSLEFYFTGSFICSYTSFVKRIPSGHSIEAFTPLRVMSIHYDDLMQQMRQSEKYSKLWQRVSEELFIKTSERLRDMLSLSATERYLNLLAAYPQYVQEIPLKYLASYLHVTPESLSRIRKNL